MHTDVHSLRHRVGTSSSVLCVYGCESGTFVCSVSMLKYMYVKASSKSYGVVGIIWRYWIWVLCGRPFKPNENNNIKHEFNQQSPGQLSAHKDNVSSQLVWVSFYTSFCVYIGTKNQNAMIFDGSRIARSKHFIQNGMIR